MSITAGNYGVGMDVKTGRVPELEVFDKWQAKKLQILTIRLM